MNPGKDVRLSEQHGLPVRWATDCKDLFDSLTKENQTSPAEKRLALELVILRELLQRPNCKVHWVATDVMMADALTKSMTTDYLRGRMKDNRWSLRDSPALAKERKKTKFVRKATNKKNASNSNTANVMNEKNSNLLNDEIGTNNKRDARKVRIANNF
jgi:hypothetical protein